jgi:hypothetical protein
MGHIIFGFTAQRVQMMEGHIAGEENAVSSRQGASKAAGAKSGGHKGSARTGHSIGLVDILNLKSRLVIFATGKLTDTKTKSKQTTTTRSFGSFG